MIDLKAITLDQFLCVPRLTEVPSAPHAFTLLADTFRPFVRDPFLDLGNGYFLHHLAEDPADVAAMYEGHLVGLYQGEAVAVDYPKHTRRGLGAALVLAAVKYRQLPNERILSPEGKATLSKAWKIANGQAASPLNIQSLI